MNKWKGYILSNGTYKESEIKNFVVFLFSLIVACLFSLFLIFGFLYLIFRTFVL